MTKQNYFDAKKMGKTRLNVLSWEIENDMYNSIHVAGRAMGTACGILVRALDPILAQCLHPSIRCLYGVHTLVVTNLSCPTQYHKSGNSWSLLDFNMCR